MARSSETSEFNYQRKADGRSALAGHLGTTVGAVLFYLITVFILNEMNFRLFPGTDLLSTIGYLAVSFLVSLFLGLLEYGIHFLHLNLIYGQQVSFGGLFDGFRRGVNDRVILVQAALSAISFVCTLPASVILSQQNGSSGIREHLPLIAALYILGLAAEIWFALGFAMCYYLIADFPQMSSGEVLRTSWRMMKGRRLKLFLLELSFLPLYLLSLLSCGIAGMWVYSYSVASSASFYKWLTTSGQN